VTAERSGVSFVVPVRNGARWLDRVLSAILAQDDGRGMEVLVVEDGSRDDSPAIARAFAARAAVRVIEGPGRGAAAAINLGIRHATHPVICQVDQDVIVEPGWMARVTAELAAPGVGAVQGYYATPPDGSLWARVMGLDLEQRYARIAGSAVDHVASGNTAYRAAALHAVGLLDESLGYGYDNDLSYRLAAAGYRLVLCRAARSVHRWRETARGYLAQQYGVGYGRLEVVARHPRRVAGDDVSGPGMILHTPAMLAACAALGAAPVVSLAGGAWRPFAAASGVVLGVLALERLVAGARAAARFRDPAALAFAPVHLLRDAAWTVALAVWTARRLRGRRSRPSDSM
jgi:glycosyltransferase involved in cell wall biosynthesis